MTSAVRFFGRRKGRPLHARKTQVLKELLPTFEIARPEPDQNGVLHLDLAGLFGVPPKTLWLEIGFGGGEHLASQAEQHVDVSFIGCEPFVNGVASLLDHVDRRQLKNVRIYPDDARVILDALPSGSVQRCFVLFADPWPKKRHRERRFIGPENLPRVARALTSGGELHLATDDAQLALWMEECLASMADFSCRYNSQTPPPGWVSTRYESKGIAAGRAPRYFIFERR